jgi:hypothetical protein
VLKGTTGTEAVGADSTLKAGESARVTFTFSEEVKGFDLRAVKVAGGFLENLVQDKTDPKKFTAMFKPADPLAGQTAVVAADISVDANRVTDVNGNSNTAASAKFKVDNIRPDVLQVTDNVASTLKAGAIVVYTYALNKAVTGLEVADFVATNGTVQAVAPVANTLVSGSGATGTQAGSATGRSAFTLRTKNHLLVEPVNRPAAAQRPPEHRGRAHGAQGQHDRKVHGLPQTAQPRPAPRPWLARQHDVHLTMSFFSPKF